MSVPQALMALLQRFRDNERQYRDAGYNETETRRELIDPFFQALGWDVDNTKGFSEKYTEVVHEARVKVGRATKAPDYAFRVGGQPIFFVEAKTPQAKRLLQQQIDVTDDAIDRLVYALYGLTPEEIAVVAGA